MTRDETLQSIKYLASQGVLTESEVLQAYREGSGTSESLKATLEHHLTITKVLYGLGGIIVVAGIIFLIGQMWDSFGAGAQVFVTLGSAIALYVAAVLLHSYKQWQSLATLFFVMAAAVMPVGIYVTLFHVATGGDAWMGQLIMAGIPAVVYFASYWLFRRPILFLIGQLFATWAMYAIVGRLLEDSGASSEFVGNVWAYVTLLVGLVYTYLGYAFIPTDKKDLTGVLYFLGSASALAAGFALTFLQDPWILIYFLLILAAMYVSTVLKSRSMLIFGAIALIAHLTHVSFEYFADSLGWPLALIISGFIIIGVGYGTVVLHKRFIT